MCDRSQRRRVAVLSRLRRSNPDNQRRQPSLGGDEKVAGRWSVAPNYPSKVDSIMFSTHLSFRVQPRVMALSAWCLLAGVLFTFGSFTERALSSELDTTIRSQLQQFGVEGLTPLPPAEPAKVELGRLLFFDHELSGNRDTSCASCHHSSLASGDARSLPTGTGGVGLGPDRTLGENRRLIPRNAPEVFDRGQPEWFSMFWDSRIQDSNGQLTTPAGAAFPAGIDNVVSAQAMFPVTSPDEMRGAPDDLDINGNSNELANFASDDFTGIWQALMVRLMAIPEYEQMFAEAYPNTPPEELGFEHAANAMGAFEAEAFSALDSDWDRYLGGDNAALTDSAKRGAHLFYGGANCAACHSGNLMTDQEHHNLAIPQLGPGKDAETGLDPGRELVTGDAEDEYRFRTPPLRNVAATGPWSHNGAYTNLEDMIRHHLDPETALANYDISQLDPLIQGTVRLEPDLINALLATVDPELPTGIALTDQDVNDLAAFLFATTSPSLDRLLSLRPDRVPSGLPVDEMPPGEFSFVYDDVTGKMTVEGTSDSELTSIMLRILGDPEELPVELRFLKGSAAWSDEIDIVLSDDDLAQSFLDYRKGSPFYLASGDSLGALLPPGLSEDTIESYLSAVYMLRGSSALLAGDVAWVPEPTSIFPWLLMAAAPLCRLARGRSGRSSAIQRR